MTAYSIIERQGAENPTQDKWPKAWRLLFLFTAGFLFWAAIALLIRWL